ncbi:MAG: transporter substrate-binding domain-containing protein [Oligoflexia bacterium]|nr:transporter substrate-binding domain-containing protein [Oligoflexia bacterium]
MINKIFFIILLVLPFVSISKNIAKEESADGIKEITVVTAEWRDYTLGGKGLYIDLLKEVFESEGIKVVVVLQPYKRATQEFLVQKKFDALLGSYAESRVIVPKYYLGNDKLTIAYNKNKVKKWNGINDLKDKIVAWEGGYGLDRYGIIKVPVKVFEISDIESAIKMLARERIDYIIDYPQMNDIIKKLNLTNKIECKINIIQGPNSHIGFHDNARGRKLIEIWDRKMDQLFKSKRLQKMYQNISDDSYDSYP